MINMISLLNFISLIVFMVVMTIEAKKLYKLLSFGLFSLSFIVLLIIKNGLIGGVLGALFILSIPAIVYPVCYLIQNYVLWKTNKQHGESGIKLQFDLLAIYKTILN